MFSLLLIPKMVKPEKKSRNAFLLKKKTIYILDNLEKRNYLTASQVRLTGQPLLCLSLQRRANIQTIIFNLKL